MQLTAFPYVLQRMDPENKSSPKDGIRPLKTFQVIEQQVKTLLRILPLGTKKTAQFSQMWTKRKINVVHNRGFSYWKQYVILVLGAPTRTSGQAPFSKGSLREQPHLSGPI